MTEHPLLLNDEMVRALQSGCKTQTRRPMMPQPEMVADRTTVPYRGNADGLFRLLERAGRKSPFGVPGDQLWIREAWGMAWNDHAHQCLCYRAEGEPTHPQMMRLWSHKEQRYVLKETECPEYPPDKWRPSIHMPRWASRDSVLVKRVWCERVQDISEADAMAEGVGSGFVMNSGWPDYQHITSSGVCIQTQDTAQMSFSTLWDGIYAKPKRVPTKGPISHYVSSPWEDMRDTREHKGKPWHVNGNPWVWACEWEPLSIERTEQ